MSHFVLELTDCFKERLAFDISDGSADFYNCNMHIIGCEITVKTALDLVGNMRDYLYGSSAIISTAFFLQNGPVNLTGCHIGILCQTFVDEALVVTEIQIGFRSIIRYEHFTVLNRVHGSRINVDIWIELLHGDFVATRFEQTS